MAGIPGVVGNTVIRLFGDAGRPTESSPDKKLIHVIQTVVNSVLEKDFQSTAIYSVVQEAVQKCVEKSQSVEAVAVKTIYALAFTVPEASLCSKNSRVSLKRPN